MYLYHRAYTCRAYLRVAWHCACLLRTHITYSEVWNTQHQILRLKRTNEIVVSRTEAQWRSESPEYVIASGGRLGYRLTRRKWRISEMLIPNENIVVISEILILETSIKNVVQWQHFVGRRRYWSYIISRVPSSSFVVGVRVSYFFVDGGVSCTLPFACSLHVASDRSAALAAHCCRICTAALYITANVSTII